MRTGSVVNSVVIGIVVAVVVVVVIAAVFFFLRARAQKQQVEKDADTTRSADPFAGERDFDAALRGNPTEITPGDIVEIRGHSWSVRGSLRLSEGSFEWAEHLLDDAEGEKRWLSVEQDPDLEIVVWTEAPQPDVSPGSRSLDWEGRRYHKEESGSAEFRSEATTGLDESGTVRYHDYTGDDDSLLSFEDYGETGKWEAATGEQLNRYELRVYPGN